MELYAEEDYDCSAGDSGSYEASEDSNDECEVAEFDSREKLAAQLNGILAANVREIEDSDEEDPDEADNEKAYQPPANCSPQYAVTQYIMSPVRSMKEQEPDAGMRFLLRLLSIVRAHVVP